MVLKEFRKKIWRMGGKKGSVREKNKLNLFKTLNENTLYSKVIGHHAMFALPHANSILTFQSEAATTQS